MSLVVVIQIVEKIVINIRLMMMVIMSITVELYVTLQPLHGAKMVKLLSMMVKVLLHVKILQLQLTTVKLIVQLQGLFQQLMNQTSSVGYVLTATQPLMTG